MADKFTTVAIVPLRRQQWPSSIRDIANASAGIAEGAYPGSEQWQGKGDAMRHLIWQALMAKKYGDTLANLAGQYHELPLGKELKAASPDQTDVERQQDLFNNQLGRDIATRSKTIEDIYKYARQAVEQGKAKYLTPEELQYEAALRSLELEKAQTQY